MSDAPVLSSKDLLELLVSQLWDFVIVLVNREGRFESWHPGVERHFGYTADEFIGQYLDLLLPAPDKSKGISEHELQTAAETGRASDTRWLARKDGQQILAEGVTLGLRGPHGLAGFGKVLRDVTEQKIAGDNLRAVAEALDQAAVIVRRWDGIIDHWTAGCERLYGWTAAEAVGRKCQELLKSNYPVAAEQIEQMLLQNGSWDGELEQERRDGARIPIATRCVLFEGGENEPRMVIETQSDITGRAQMQRELESVNERLRKMTMELERSNEELEQFAHIASHDLSAPITSTRWLVDLLASRHAAELNAEAKKIIQQITIGLERMGNLVEGILAHAQMGMSAIGSTEPVKAGDALSIALENLRKDIETSHADIEYGPLPDLEVDAHALTQLFQNLLSNAVKYRRQDVPLEIRIGATREGSMWRMHVADNGMGIEPEWFERIFLPLQRRHGREISGSGIGLATCKKIVTRAGGRIWVESEVGSGSTFLFTLPGPENS